jgi:hypothetical protein
LLALAIATSCALSVGLGAAGVASAKVNAPVYLPARIKPPISPHLPAEGWWSIKDNWVKGAPDALTMFYRPFVTTPTTVAYVGWFRANSVIVGLYPGYEGPGPTTFNRGPEEVPPTARKYLLATFNSGFYEMDAAAGFFAHDILYHPMIKGLATLVEYANGTIDVVNWQWGTRPAPTIVMARQNLKMLVQTSLPTAASTNNTLWGLTLHGAPAVYRTGVGVDRHGDLLYVAATAVTSTQLAKIFTELGAVRAMELDINPEWPILITYGAAGAQKPQLDLKNSKQVADRFLYFSTKDFFAVYVRQPHQEVPPW